MKKILIVDDDPAQRRLMQAVIEKQGFKALQADGGEVALEMLNGENPEGIDLVLLDLVMPGMSGMEALEAMSRRFPDIPVIVLTAQGGIETVVKAMQAGAVDFSVKPASPERIGVGIRNALKLSQLSGEVTRLKTTKDGALTFEDMISSAPVMRQVVRLGQRAAKSNIPILVTGESGVGKELIARAIQGESDRSGRPFVTVNCGAIPENLVESILFGHEKGSFTGADKKHIGKFQEASGGTLFLDEVGELPLDMQVKLLRVLQEGEVDPVGAKKPVRVDVRIISATNRDLSEQVRDGAFREDLFYRLNVFPIEAPPLRDRKQDIPALVEHFIQRFNAQENRSIQSATPETLSMLKAEYWPGNVRQLENMIFRAVILSDGEELHPEDFPHLTGVAPVFDDEDHAEPEPVNGVETHADAAESLIEHAVPVPMMDDNGHLRPLEDIERDLIQFAIETYAGRMAEVARRLGIGRSTLYRKVREHELEVDSAREAV